MRFAKQKAELVETRNVTSKNNYFYPLLKFWLWNESSPASMEPVHSGLVARVE